MLARWLQPPELTTWQLFLPTSSTPGFSSTPYQDPATARRERSPPGNKRSSDGDLTTESFLRSGTHHRGATSQQQTEAGQNVKCQKKRTQVPSFAAASPMVNFRPMNNLLSCSLVTESVQKYLYTHTFDSLLIVKILKAFNSGDQFLRLQHLSHYLLSIRLYTGG